MEKRKNKRNFDDQTSYKPKKKLKKKQNPIESNNDDNNNENVDNINDVNDNNNDNDINNENNINDSNYDPITLPTDDLNTFNDINDDNLNNIPILHSPKLSIDSMSLLKKDDNSIIEQNENSVHSINENENGIPNIDTIDDISSVNLSPMSRIQFNNAYMHDDNKTENEHDEKDEDEEKREQLTDPNDKFFITPMSTPMLTNTIQSQQNELLIHQPLTRSRKRMHQRDSTNNNNIDGIATERMNVATTYKKSISIPNEHINDVEIVENIDKNTKSKKNQKKDAKNKKSKKSKINENFIDVSIPNEDELPKNNEDDDDLDDAQKQAKMQQTLVQREKEFENLKNFWKSIDDKMKSINDNKTKDNKTKDSKTKDNKKHNNNNNDNNDNNDDNNNPDDVKSCFQKISYREFQQKNRRRLRTPPKIREHFVKQSFDDENDYIPKGKRTHFLGQKVIVDDKDDDNKNKNDNIKNHIDNNVNIRDESSLISMIN